MFRPSLSTVAAAGTLALAACNPFRSPMKQAPVVQVSTRDVNANARWHGTLTSPSNLAGAVQMTGSISMTCSRRARRGCLVNWDGLAT